jgi:hypothetical protein
MFSILLLGILRYSVTQKTNAEVSTQELANMGKELPPPFHIVTELIAPPHTLPSIATMQTIELAI